MQVCFIHQNLPAQYRHLIAALLARGDQVLAIGEQAALRRWGLQHPNLGLFGYVLPAPAAPAPRGPALAGLPRQVERAEAVLRGLRQLPGRGVRPDLVVAHPGWGETLYLRGALPDVPFLAYCEFFYRARGSDVDFDPEYPVGADHWKQLQLRNLPHLLALSEMDAGWCATDWQRQQFPAAFQPKLLVQHEGVDTDLARPDPHAEVTVGGRTLRAGDPVVTFVARNLEPYRGFHTFMRCLPLLQQLAPRAVAVVVGGDGVSYGLRLPPGESYRARLVRELEGRVDWSRVVFAGPLPYAVHLRVLQVSAVHAYLSYPFVLSWSMLEAMACGGCIVGSDTPPVREVLVDGANGRLTDFFDAEALARRLAEVLNGQVDVTAWRAAARQTALQRYDLKRVCLPAGLAMLDRVAAGRG